LEEPPKFGGQVLPVATGVADEASGPADGAEFLFMVRYGPSSPVGLVTVADMLALPL
jgi:hypothetical protein